MSEIIKSQKNGAGVPAEKQNELRQVTDALLMDTDTELTKRQAMSVPITSLASLGAAVSSIAPALRTVTETTTFDMQGLYTLANEAAGDVLKVAKNGNFWGSFKTLEGKSKFVQLQQAGPISASTVTELPANPATIMMAVALHSIEQRLDSIEEMEQQILDFLVRENESQIEADVQMLSAIISKYKFNWDNEHYVASNHKMVLDIQRAALKNMRSYQKQVSALLKKKQQLLVAQNDVESTYADMQKLFKYYRMALYTYSLASLLEIMLGGNYKEEYIGTVKTEIEQFAMDYRNFFKKASKRLEQLGNGAIDAKLLKGVGTAGKSVGKFIGTVPQVSRGPVDELLQEGGARLTNKANRLEKRAVHKFAALGNPGTSTLTEQMNDMIQIYNHTERICIDSECIYLLPEAN